MIMSGPPASNPFPHRLQIPSCPLWMCELTAEQYRLWQRKPFAMTGYFTSVESSHVSQPRKDYEADLWLNLTESCFETWVEGWLEGVEMEMFADAGRIEAKVVSVWQRYTCEHEPGFLIAADLDSMAPTYRVLVMSRDRPGSDQPFNRMQKARFDYDHGEKGTHDDMQNASEGSPQESEEEIPQDSEEETDTEVHTLSSMDLQSSDESEPDRPRRGMLWGVHVNDNNFRAWIERGARGLNNDTPFIPIVGDGGIERRAWVALMNARASRDWHDQPLDLGNGQRIVFTQEVQVQTAHQVFNQSFAVCVYNQHTNEDLLLGLCAYPTRPWTSTGAAPRARVLPGRLGIPDARAPTVPRPPGYEGGPTANSVMRGVTNCHEVLLDSGANEILRQEDHKPTRSIPLPVTLANGTSVDAFRTKEGEVVVVGENSGDTICGVNRLVQVGCKFVWDQSGPELHLPEELGNEVESLREENGLPFMTRQTFLKLRPLMTRHWKNRHSVKAAVSCETTAEVCNILSWDDLDQVINLQEETALKAVSSSNPDGEEYAKELLNRATLTRTDVLNAVNRANLKPTVTNRMNKLEGNKHLVSLWVFGSWVKGGLRGITAVTRSHPNLTRLLTRYMSENSKGPFISVVVSRDCVFKPHRDPNDIRFATTLIGLSKHTGGELWVEHDEGDCARITSPDAPPMPGHLHPTADGKVVTFWGNKLHGTEPYEGSRTVEIGYVPRNWEKLSEGDLKELVELGFRMPCALENPKSLKSLTSGPSGSLEDPKNLKSLTPGPSGSLEDPKNLKSVTPGPAGSLDPKNLKSVTPGPAGSLESKNLKSVTPGPAGSLDLKNLKSSSAGQTGSPVCLEYHKQAARGTPEGHKQEVTCAGRRGDMFRVFGDGEGSFQEVEPLRHGSFAAAVCHDLADYQAKGIKRPHRRVKSDELSTGVHRWTVQSCSQWRQVRVDWSLQV